MTESLLDKVRKAVNGEEKWALLYLMEWPEDQCNKPRFVRVGMAIFPDVHGFYDTEKDAREAAASKGPCNGYYVRKMRNYTGSGI
jgi:hypothetical protein